jgi:hypothetical protein
LIEEIWISFFLQDVFGNDFDILVAIHALLPIFGFCHEVVVGLLYQEILKFFIIDFHELFSFPIHISTNFNDGNLLLWILNIQAHIDKLLNDSLDSVKVYLLIISVFSDFIHDSFLQPINLSFKYLFFKHFPCRSKKWIQLGIFVLREVVSIDVVEKLVQDEAVARELSPLIVVLQNVITTASVVGHDGWDYLFIEIIG